MSTHNLCFEQKCEKYQNFLSENLVVKFSVYLNRRVFVMLPSNYENFQIKILIFFIFLLQNN